MNTRIEIKSFQFLPDSLTVIERLREDEEEIANGAEEYHFFMPVEEAGHVFVLACRCQEDSDGQYDELELYNVNNQEFEDDWREVLLVTVSRKFLYDMLAEAGLTPEQISFGNEEKQRVLQKAFYSALG